MQPEQQQRIMGYFIEEAKDHLNTIEQGLLNLQNTIQDTEMVNEVFRAAHSVKGGAAMLGLSSVQQTAHRLEDCFKVLKECPVTIDQKLEALFLQVFDILQALIEQLQTPFGLTEEVASNIMSGVEPVFEELNNHLEYLVNGTSTGAVTSNGQAAQRNRQAIQEIFQKEILAHLREMLQLFKQADAPSQRQQLQEICHQMRYLGEQFDLSNWAELLTVSSAAIANPENSSRTLAGIVIKEIKQAQELVLAGREAEILPSLQLKSLVPPATVVEPTPVETPVASATETVYTNTYIAADLNTEYEQISQPLELETNSSQPRRIQPSANKSASAVKPGADPHGPEVGMAELNSLADLFEGEASDFDETWQEEEILSHGEPKQGQNAQQSLPVDAMSDFSDLFEETAGANLSGAANVSQDDDFMSLFGDESLEDAVVANTNGSSKQPSAPSLPVANSTRSDTDDDFSDLLFGEPNSIQASEDLTSLFDDESWEETPESLEFTDSFDLSLDAAPTATPDQNNDVDDLFLDLPELEDVNQTPAAIALDPVVLDQLADQEENLTNWLTDLDESDAPFTLDSSASLGLELDGLGTQEEAIATPLNTELDASSLFEETPLSETSDFSDLFETPAVAADSELAIDEAELGIEWPEDESVAESDLDLSDLGLDTSADWTLDDTGLEMFSDTPDVATPALDLDQESFLSDSSLDVEAEATAPDLEWDAIDTPESEEIATSPTEDAGNFFDFDAGLDEQPQLTLEDSSSDFLFADEPNLDLEASDTHPVSFEQPSDAEMDALFEETPTADALELPLDSGFEAIAESELDDLDLLAPEPDVEASVSEAFDFGGFEEPESSLAFDELDNFFETEPESLSSEAAEFEMPLEATATSSEAFDFGGFEESESSLAFDELDNFFETEPESLSSEAAEFELPLEATATPSETLDFDGFEEPESGLALDELDNFFETEPESLSSEAAEFELPLEATATPSEADENMEGWFDEATPTPSSAEMLDFSEAFFAPDLEAENVELEAATSNDWEALVLPESTHNLGSLLEDETLDVAAEEQGLSEEITSDWNLQEELTSPAATEQPESLFSSETLESPENLEWDMDFLTPEAEAIAELEPLSLETDENLETTSLSEDESFWDSELFEEESTSEAATSDSLTEAGMNQFLDFSDASTEEDTTLDDLLSAPDERLAFAEDLSWETAEEEEAQPELGLANDEEFDALEAFLDEPPNLANAQLNGVDEFAQLEALLGEPSAPAAAEEAVEDWSELDDMLLGIEEATDTAPARAAKPSEVKATEAEVDDFSDIVHLLDQAQNLGIPQTVKPSPGQGRVGTGNRPRSTKIFEQTMRVSVKHLDNLSNLVGELVVNRNSLEQDQERMRQSLDNLLNYVQQLSDVGSRMQNLYERSLLESSLLASRQNYRSASKAETPTQSSHAAGMDYDPLEMDRFTPIHLLSQEMIELIVRVRESASDIEFLVDETDQVARMLRQVTTQLQEGLTRSRMVAFAQTVDRLQRGVRDNAHKYGKQVDLHVEGRETLIDKVILEHLLDPLTHMLNNGIAHGIESPEVRKAHGKPPVGRITLRAFHQGNQTVISVSDDGAGIDTERVKTKALKMGLIKPAEAQTMTPIDIYDLLFHPGFSMKDKADELAGRGVGMDVVRTSLTEIRGTISTESTLGKGTHFTIRLPLTLSISKALYCVSDKASIAFPMDGVEDMLDVPKDRIQTNSDGKTCIPWRDTLLPFQPLSELLTYNRQISRGSVYGGTREDNMISIVVLRSVGNFIAIEVDRVEGEQEIVIKQLQGPVPKPVGIAGATVLGDGRIMPIADILELIDLSRGIIRKESGSGLWSGAQAPTEAAPVKLDPMVLIVDDSITVRELLSMTFNKAGYRVEQARDGQEAWDKLRSGLPCDIVFCDIEMPRMDGLELLSRIQKDDSLNHLPVAMLTSRGADRHRQMASQLGASGYFTNPHLEEALLDAAQRMMKGEVLLTSSANA